MDILDRIKSDDELLELYNNDETFKCVIEHALLDNLDYESALILVIKYGYKAKRGIFDHCVNILKNQTNIIYVKE